MRQFDEFSDQYDALLKDPIRDNFMAGDPLFFHLRKRDLIRKHFEQYNIETRKLAYLDLGCGKGELARLLRQDFALVHGCEPSVSMLRSKQLETSGVKARVQENLGKIP